jgi:hypothetical protein
MQKDNHNNTNNTTTTMHTRQLQQCTKDNYNNTNTTKILHKRQLQKCTQEPQQCKQDNYNNAHKTITNNTHKTITNNAHKTTTTIHTRQVKIQDVTNPVTLPSIYSMYDIPLPLHSMQNFYTSQKIVPADLLRLLQHDISNPSFYF